ncbi:EamA family transporter [Streptomyces sp. NPDC049541]|uniref:EamA family transporter n=1 Tax=Streptomyces sp. NPDC049541 TaxID=3365594 RepID=UPI0037B5320D
MDASATAGYLWLGSAGGLIASTLWFRGIGKLPVGASAPLVLLSPLVAAVIGVALSESLSLLQTFGFILALAALLAAQLNAPKLSGRLTRGTAHHSAPRKKAAPTKSGLTIAVPGATGMVGSRGIDEAGARGHRVPAMFRKPAVNAEVLAVRTVQVDEEFLVGTTRTVLDIAARLGIRVLVIGGAGALRGPEDRNLLVTDNEAYVPGEKSRCHRLNRPTAHVPVPHECPSGLPTRRSPWSTNSRPPWKRPPHHGRPPRRAAGVGARPGSRTAQAASRSRHRRTGGSVRSAYARPVLAKP